MKRIIPLLALILIIGSCKKPYPTQPFIEKNPQFPDYWFNGQAEISSYDLLQSRYGEIHQGEAVLIFVKETYSKSKQVKLDDWRNSDDKMDVMKMNFTRKFNTGIYPYSTMLSAFSALETGRLVKLTHSIQEWCGQVFSQVNVRDGRIEYVGRSYFETEGDVEKSLEIVYTEDELWNLIRLQPDLLPRGNHLLIPSSTTLRFNHLEMQPLNAFLELVSNVNSDSSIYTIAYSTPESRTLKIHFEKEFPHKILKWEELSESNGRTLITRGTLRKSIRLDYWNKNGNEHETLRKLLQ